MSDYSKYVPNVHFEQIPIKYLVSNQEYQRSLSNSHVLNVADHFDLYQINPVKVSRRDGINYVFNGQHTIEIVALVSGSRDTPVWCMIYDDLSYEHEADIFANQMKHIKYLQPYEVFAANIEAGNELQMMIKRLVESYGLTIGVNKAPGVVSAISTLESIYQKYGYHVLNRTIRLCVGAWEGEPNSMSANMLRAVAKLVITYKKELDDEEFKEKVGNYSIKQISRQAKERRQGSMGYAETLVLAYNGKKKNSPFILQLEKLYAKVSITPDEEIYNDEEEYYLFSEEQKEAFEDDEPTQLKMLV